MTPPPLPTPPTKTPRQYTVALAAELKLDTQTILKVWRGGVLRSDRDHAAVVAALAREGLTVGVVPEKPAPVRPRKKKAKRRARASKTPKATSAEPATSSAGEG